MTNHGHSYLNPNLNHTISYLHPNIRLTQLFFFLTFLVFEDLVDGSLQVHTVNTILQAWNLIVFDGIIHSILSHAIEGYYLFDSVVFFGAPGFFRGTPL